MTLRLVDPRAGGTVRALSPRLADCLRAGKEDWNAAPAPVRRACRRTLAYVHRNGLRVRCDCRPEGPVFAVRRLPSGRYVTFNLAGAAVPHAADCPFRRGRVRPAAWIAGGNADLLDLFTGRVGGDGADPDADRRPYRGPPGVSTGAGPKTVSYAVRKLLETARLNRIEVADRHPEPRRWLAEIETAAGMLRVPPGLPASEFLFTDPGRWRAGAVHARLDAAARRRPRIERPFAMLCWPADEADDDGIDPRDRHGARVQVRTRLVRPETGSYPVRGPYLFLGAVARPEDGSGWDCVAAYAQPIAALGCPVPVESGYERAAVGALRDAARSLRDCPLLNDALGGAVRVEVEKPLTAIETDRGPCLPDFLVTVTRPGADRRLPGGPGARNRRGRHRPRDRARYIVEAMGRDDPDYERRKERTHAAMARIGRVFRIEARDFEAGPDSLQRRCRHIAGIIRGNLFRRWNAG